MESRRDGGQMILLAGILLVIAFIAFTIQLSVLPNLGQEQGRESVNSVREDYEVIRRLFQSLLVDELRDPADADVHCIDGFDYLQRIRGHLTLLTAHEGMRGQSFGWDRLEVERMAGSTTDYEVRIQMRLTDGVTTVGDEVEYPIECNAGAITGCSPACVAVPF